jgi:hypothetical protein
MANPPDEPPFNLNDLRARIETVRRSAINLDQGPLAPEALVQLHLAMIALEAASIHVYAATLVPARVLTERPTES